MYTKLYEPQIYKKYNRSILFTLMLITEIYSSEKIMDYGNV